MPADLELRPTVAGRVVMMAFGALLLALAVAMVVMAKHNGSELAVGPIAMLGVVGAVVLAIGVRLGARRLIIDGDGVEVRGMLGGSRLAWADIASYDFVSLDVAGNIQTHKAAGRALNAVMDAVRGTPHRHFMAGELTLRGSNRRKVTITPAFRALDQGLDRIFDTIHPRLATSNPGEHGVITLQDERLRYDDKVVMPYAKIEKVSVSITGKIAIHARDKAQPGMTFKMSRVACPLLLFERLVDLGVAVELAPSVFLPLSMLERLARPGVRAG